MAPRLGLCVNMVRIFLEPLRGKFYGKYLARCMKMDVGQSAKTLKYTSYVLNMTLRNLLNLVDLDALDMWWGWKKATLCSKLGGSAEIRDQSWASATSQRRTSQGLGAEIGELMYSQERSGGNSLRRSSATEGCYTNGKKSTSRTP